MAPGFSRGEMMKHALANREEVARVAAEWREANGLPADYPVVGDNVESLDTHDEWRRLNLGVD